MLPGFLPYLPSLPAGSTSWHSRKLRPQRRSNRAMWGGTTGRRAQRRSSMGATDNLGCTGHDGLDAVGDMGAYNGAWKAWAVWTTIGAVDGIGAWKTWAVSTTLADRPRQLDDPTWFIASISPLLFPLTHCEQFHASTVFIALHALARPTCSYPCPCLMFACLPPWTSGWPCSLFTDPFLSTRAIIAPGLETINQASELVLDLPPALPVPQGPGGCSGRVPAADGIHFGIVLMGPPVLSWWLPSALVTLTSPACVTPPARILTAAARALHCMSLKPCILHEALLTLSDVLDLQKVSPRPSRKRLSN